MKRGVRSARLAAGVLALLLLAVACGGTDDGTTSGDAAATPTDTAGDGAATPTDDGGATEDGGTEGGSETEDGGETASGDFEYVDGVLQPLPDGFPDRPITLVSTDEPGGRDGIYARALDQALADISPVDIIVSDEPRAQGGAFNALADVAARPDGEDGYQPVILSIPGSVSDFHVEPIEEEAGIGLDDANIFIVTETQPFFMVQSSEAAWEPTFDAFVEYARANPGEVRYISSGVGSGTDLAVEWLLRGLDLEVTKIPQSPVSAAMAAVASGEGDFTMSNADFTRPAVESGRAEVIFVTTQNVPEEFDRPGVAAAKDYERLGLEPTSWGIVLGMMVPATVPDEHVAWMHELFRAATETEVYQERTETIPGVEIDVMGTEETNQLARQVYESSEEIVRALGLHHEDQ